MTKTSSYVAGLHRPQPLVSIIVITYNSIAFVVETLESAKAQTYENIELIVSDDASTDDTVEVCQQWLDENKERFVRTELITVPENTGIPANCNRGLRAAKGEWIKYIAGDDALMEDCVEKNISFVKKRKEIKMLFSSMAKYNEAFNEASFFKISRPYRQHFFSDSFSASDQHQFFLKRSGFFGITPTSFIEKGILLSLGGFDERFPLIEDLPMWIKATKNGYKLYFMDELTVKHRLHNNNVHAVKKKNAVDPSYFRIEEVRKEYIYPYVGRNIKTSFKIKDIVSKIWYNNQLLNSSLVGKKLYRLILKASGFLTKLK